MSGKGILLFGHGARNPDWAAPFVAIRDLIRAREPKVPVEMGFLELMRPSFDEAVASLATQGVTEIVVVPIFMAAGSHIRKDLPQMAANAMDRHTGVRITLAAPVGEAAPVLAAMADYALSQPLH
jgi:sirohydrochlorin cobaltochelatase